jgi:hypothetical protein
MSLEREVLLYRSEARQKSLHAFRKPEATQAGLAFTLRLMASICTGALRLISSGCPCHKRISADATTLMEINGARTWRSLGSTPAHRINWESFIWIADRLQLPWPGQRSTYARRRSLPARWRACRS